VDLVIEVAETMPGPPEVVWELITDWEHQDDWMLEATDFRVTSTQREGIGVRAEATVRIAGITTRDEVEVVAWEPERQLGITHGGWVSGRGDLYLTRIAPGRTHVFWREQFHAPWGVFGGLGITPFRPIMKRIFQRDLRILAGLVRVRSLALPKEGRASSGD